MQQHQRINAASEAFAREFSLALAMSTAANNRAPSDTTWASGFAAGAVVQPLNSQTHLVPASVPATGEGACQHFPVGPTQVLSRRSSCSSLAELHDDERHPLLQHSNQHHLEDLRGASDLEDLVDCFRESVEENLRRSRDRSASRSSSCSTTTSRSSKSSSSSNSAQCELVTALQNHLKSAVAAAAAVAASSAPHNLHHHNRRPQQPQQQQQNQSNFQRDQQATTSCVNRASRDRTAALRVPSPSIPLDLKILPEYEMWHDRDGDQSMSSTRSHLSVASDRVQHTETVQTTTSNLDQTTGGPTGPSDYSLAATASATTTNACDMTATLLAAEPPPPPPPPPPVTSTASSQGGHHIKQRRLYKCRHCPFETDKKIENWQHIRIHMRPEKLLSCGSCLFVTEYKHHLEYHQRNHTGYKPFKCEHCDYTCVNKSMLNSHMKSHSSVYQYQCGDCKYATKYVHSLKMHLRKYNHQPAAYMIDIFGRKRGPKPGSGRKQQQLKQQRELQQQQQSNSSSGPAAAGTVTTANGKAKKQSTRQQQQQQQCILDLRVDSKLAAR